MLSGEGLCGQPIRCMLLRHHVHVPCILSDDVPFVSSDACIDQKSVGRTLGAQQHAY